MLDDPRIDVVTAYHGKTNFDKNGNRTDKLWKVVSKQNPELVKQVGAKKLKAELDTWQNMEVRSKEFKRLTEKNASRKKSKLCCVGGKCSRDTTKCGYGLRSLIIGVHLPMLGEDGDD